MTVKEFMNSISRWELGNFYSKINKIENGCWIWTGARSNGRYEYGRMTFRSKNWLSHRFAAFFIGRNTEAYIKKVLHKCDNCLCVNPEHLFVGTQTDNMQDMLNKQREARGEKHGLTKLSNVQAKEIRNLYPQFTYTQLALQFKVSEACIGRIIRGESYNV